MSKVHKLRNVGTTEIPKGTLLGDITVNSYPPVTNTLAAVGKLLVGL
jgi:hypothetical protein